MGKLKDLTGMKFSRLTVIKRSDDKISPKGNNRTQWECICDCGTTVIVNSYNLLRNKTQSCGCLQKEKIFELCKKYNTYDLSGEYGIGYTTKGEQFYFDLEDYDKIKDYCWCIDCNGYVTTNLTGGGHILQHRFIMNANKNEIIDHIYHKTNDNRKSQLRICTNSQNLMNSKIPINNTSGTKGVSWNKRRCLWCATLWENNKRHEKHFENKEEAITYRIELEKLYYKDFNFKQDN